MCKVLCDLKYLHCSVFQVFFPPEIMISAVFSISTLEHWINLCMDIFISFYLIRIRNFMTQILITQHKT